MTDPMRRGRLTEPIHRGDTVERAQGPGAVNMHAVLEHLERKGFPLSARMLGETEDGREILTRLEGDTGYPPLAGHCSRRELRR